MGIREFTSLFLRTMADMMGTRSPWSRIAVLNMVWGHHARRSGYHLVADGLGISIPPENRVLPAILSRPLCSLLGDRKLERAAQIVLAMRLFRRDTVLVTNGDFSLELVQEIKRISNVRIFAVFHQLASFLLKDEIRSAKGLFDGVICVARCQLSTLKPLAAPGKAWFVPHGVDTTYFTPGDACGPEPTLLCVGTNYRDFTSLGMCARIVRARNPRAKIRLLAPKRQLPGGLESDAIELVTDVNDERLRAEYRTAWGVLLPLTDCTANNSVLEAIACGKPLAVSDVGGIRDYLDSSCAMFCAPGDAQAHAVASLAILNDPGLRDRLGRAARKRSEDFAWPRIRDRVRSLLLQ